MTTLNRIDLVSKFTLGSLQDSGVRTDDGMRRREGIQRKDMAQNISRSAESKHLMGKG